MTYHRATVEIFLKADQPGNVEDALSGLLTENGVYNEGSPIMDWCYSMHPTPVCNTVAEDRGVQQEEYFSTGPDRLGLFSYTVAPKQLPPAKDKNAIDLMQEVRRMMTAGRTHQSSYEGQIIEKIDEAIATLVGKEPEVVDVRFEIPRSDLVALFTHGGPGSEYMGLASPGEVNELPTSTLLSYVLQQALYDSNDGPMLEGEFSILPKKDA